MNLARRVDKVNKIRREGLTPGVIYGREIESTPIQADTKEILQAYRTYGKTRTFKITLEGEEHNVYFKEVQILILKPNDIVHFSIQKVSATDTIIAAIPIVLEGRHHVENQGLLVQHIMQSIEVEYPATTSIDNIEVDVSSFAFGDAVYVKDLQIPENTSIKADGEEMVANVVYPELPDEPETEEELDVEEVAEDAETDTEETDTEE